MSYPNVRKKVVQAFVQKIEEMPVKPDVIAGCATAGIPHAAWLAAELDLPMVYVRSAPKGHGKGNQIEGLIEAGQRVVLIEDLISTGGSVIESAQALQNAGAEVLHILAIFTYGLEKSKQQFSKENLSFETITNYDELINYLEENGQINQTEKEELETWRNNLQS
jgi:orotate phosphoribosyltransferase